MSIDQPSLEQGANESSEGQVVSRAMSAFRAGVAVVRRHSSMIGVKRSKGSARFQLAEYERLIRMGVDASAIVTVEMLGESGREDADRPRFEWLLGEIRAKRIRVVVVSVNDRLGRNEPDSWELYAALREVEGFIMIGGRLFDPSDLQDRTLLELQAVIAAADNRNRMLFLIMSRLAMARTCEIMCCLPTGLVWASPDDPEYVRRLTHLGLGDWLDPKRLARYKARVTRDGGVYYPLPHPDPAVWKTVQLRREWILVGMSVPDIVRRMSTDPEWPRNHPTEEYPDGDPRPCLPVYRFPQFDSARPTVWRPVVTALGKPLRWARLYLYRWFRCPALYGTYTFSGQAAREGARRALLADVQDVCVEEAFQGPFSPEERSEVQALLARPSSEPRFRGSYTGPRDHLFDNLRCGAFRPDGEICGRRLHAAYSASGRYVYGSPECSFDGHPISPPNDIEQTVLGIVREAFEPGAMAQLLNGVRRRHSDGLARRRVLAREIEVLEGRIQSTYECEEAASSREDRVHWQSRRERHRAALKGKRAELARLDGEEANIRSLEDAEVEQIIRLGARIDALMVRARVIPGKVREILSELVTRVVVRRLGTGVHWVEVEFPSGRRTGRIYFSQVQPGTQPIRAMAHTHLAGWLDPGLADRSEGDAVAEALAVQLSRTTDRRGERRSWTATRVWAAAWFHVVLEERLRPGEHETVAELASRIGSSPEAVLRTAFRARLGPARVSGGELTFRPTRSELHRSFPEFARRDVSGRAGWDVAETVTLRELAAVSGASWRQCRRAARRYGLLRRDERGRVYTHRTLLKQLNAETLDDLLRKAPESLAKLDREFWVTFREALARFPGVTRSLLLSRLPLVGKRSRTLRGRGVYVWVGPGAKERLHVPTLAEEVEQLGRPDLRVEDFHACKEVVPVLLERFGYPNEAALTWFAKHGTVVRVKASWRGAKLRSYVHVPPEVLQTSDFEMVLRWLGGGELPIRRMRRNKGNNPAPEP